MDLPSLQFSWQWLKSCPLCHKQREVMKTELLKENNDGYWFYFQCPHCAVGLIFCLDQQQGLPKFSGCVTDLTPVELLEGLEAGERTPLQADEVLTLHEFFAKNNQVSLLIK
jgi:hypothetical protein